MKIIQAMLPLLILVSQCFSTIASDITYPLQLLNSPVLRLPAVNKKVTQGDVRALVLLVQFSDIKFRNADPVSQFNDYLNKEGYNEYHNAGSVRDYFLKSSYGMFRPTFNVMAPVTLSKTKAYYGGRSDTDRNFNGTVQAVREALQLLDWNAIDFSLYDNDGNGVVDFVSVIFAGVGSDGSGIVESIWPHKGSVGNMMVGGGLVVDDYSCSNELASGSYIRNEETGVLGGIGTFIHEFSHVLGLPDLYATQGRNTRPTPKFWSVMDIGSNSCPTNDDYVSSCAPILYCPING